MEFNEDNAKIDAALGTLSAGLTAAETALAGKLGHSQVIANYKPGGGASSGYGFNSPIRNWDDWEYICVLASYPESADQSLVLEFDIDTPGPHKVITPLAMPGYLAVFLPRHDGSKPASGFVLSNRFVPFSLSFSFQNIRQLLFNIKSGTSSNPEVTVFGGK